MTQMLYFAGHMSPVHRQGSPQPGMRPPGQGQAMQMQNRFMRPAGPGFGVPMRPPTQQQMQQMQMQGGQMQRGQMAPGQVPGQQQMMPGGQMMVRGQMPGQGQMIAAGQPRQMMPGQAGMMGVPMRHGMQPGQSPVHPGMSPGHSVNYGSPGQHQQPPMTSNPGPMRRPSGSNVASPATDIGRPITPRTPHTPGSQGP